MVIALASLSGLEARRTAKVEIGDSVRAEVPTTVTLINHSGFNATRVVLSFYPPAWDSKSKFGRTGNQCLLVKEVGIKPEANNTLSVTIPALVAPAGALCALEFSLNNAATEPSQGIRGIIADSNDFALVKRNDMDCLHNITADDANYECTRGCPGIRWPPISIVQNARAMEALTGGGASTPTRSTCAPTTWSASNRRAKKDEL